MKAALLTLENNFIPDGRTSVYGIVKTAAFSDGIFKLNIKSIFRFFNFWKRNISSDSQKVELIVASADILGIQFQKSFQEIRERDIQECFKQKLLPLKANCFQNCSSNGPMKQRKFIENQLKAFWISLSKEILTSYCRDPTSLSNSVIKMIDDKVKKKTDSKSIFSTIRVKLWGFSENLSGLFNAIKRDSTIMQNIGARSYLRKRGLNTKEDSQNDQLEKNTPQFHFQMNETGQSYFYDQSAKFPKKQIFYSL